MIYLYKLNEKWRIGPDYENKKAWLFTKTGDLTDDTIWYTVICSHVYFERPIGREHGCRRRQETNFKVTNLIDENNKPIYDNIRKSIKKVK